MVNVKYLMYLNRCPASTKNMLKELEKLIDVDSWKQIKELVCENVCNCQVKGAYNVNNIGFNAKGTCLGKSVESGNEYKCLIEISDNDRFVEHYVEMLKNYLKSKRVLVDTIVVRT